MTVERVVYVIHSADVMSDCAHTIRHMEQRIAPFSDSLDLTIGDEGYGCDYLADECENERYRNGMHRTWAGELTWTQWLAFADAYTIDLDDDGVPERYESTLGSITEHGHIPAISVDDSEGWGSDGGVIDSRIYVSIATLEAIA